MCHSAHILRDIDLQNLQTVADGADGWGVTAQCGYMLTADWEVMNSAANRLIGEVVQSRRRPLLGPSPG